MSYWRATMTGDRWRSGRLTSPTTLECLLTRTDSWWAWLVFNTVRTNTLLLIWCMCVTLTVFTSYILYMLLHDQLHFNWLKLSDVSVSITWCCLWLNTSDWHQSSVSSLALHCPLHRIHNVLDQLIVYFYLFVIISRVWKLELSLPHLSISEKIGLFTK